MSVIDEHWESLADFVEHVASSGARRLGNNRSQDTGDFFGDTDLPTFLAHCRTLKRDDFPERARTIDDLATALTGDLPAGVSIRRQPVWGRSGASVNVQKVLRGDLGHAWRGTRRQHRPSAGGLLTLLVVWNASGTISEAQIQWSAIATLALADYARRTGRRVELWAVAWNVNAFDHGADYRACVRLVRAGEAWDTSHVVLTTYPEWLRRLKFRAIEMTARRAGGMTKGSYGSPQRAGALLAWARDAWAPAQGSAPASVVLGCTQDDNVSDRASAQRWIEERLERLTTD